MCQANRGEASLAAADIDARRTQSANSGQDSLGANAAGVAVGIAEESLEDQEIAGQDSRSEIVRGVEGRSAATLPVWSPSMPSLWIKLAMWPYLVAAAGNTMSGSPLEARQASISKWGRSSLPG